MTLLQRSLMTIGVILCASASLMAQSPDVIVLVDSTSVLIEKEDSYTCYQHKEFLLTNNRAGDMTDVVLGMDSKMNLLSFEYQMFDLQGNLLRTLKKKDLLHVNYSHDLGTDSYRLEAEVTPPRYPVLIKQSTKIARHGNILSYPIFAPQIRRDMAVEHAVYRISWPADKIRMRQKAINMDQKTPVATGNQLSLTYVLNSLKEIPSAPFSIPFEETAPVVMFAPEQFNYYGFDGQINDWKSMGLWYNGLTEGGNILSEISKQKLMEAIAPCQTDLEKIKAAFDLMGRQTRYVSLQLGIGGYMPMSPGQVYSMGFGDCKGLSNYMRCMLQEIGISSQLVLVGTDDPRLVKDFANFFQLDHMVLEVFLPQAGKVDTMWLECTNPDLPIGYVHPDISGHDAIEISSQGGRLLRIPEYADSLNLKHTNISIALDWDASADVQVDSRDECHCYLDNCKYLKSKEQDQRTQLLSLYNLPGATAEEVELKEACELGGKPGIETHIKVSAPKYANLTGRRLFVPINPSRYPIFLTMKPGSSNEKMFLSHGFREEVKTCLTLPARVTIESLPGKVQIENDFASFTQTVECSDSQVTVISRMDVHAGTYPAEARARMTEMQKAVAKAYSAKLVLLRK